MYRGGVQRKVCSKHHVIKHIEMFDSQNFENSKNIQLNDLTL